MHAVKVGWGGQTFALARCSDSGGKKSRVRRSKEERKSMVESFIKKYQKSNNGSFPSLNLTHKEVGGSFYTVREIVREIIQENRVLGPAKLTMDDQNIDQILEQYPLGSISTNPSSQLLDANNNVCIASEPQIVNGVVSTYNEEVSQSQKQLVDSIGNINGILVDNQDGESHTSELEEQYEEADTSKFTSHTEEEMLDSDAKTCQEGLQNSLISSSEVTYMERDVVVETFPIRAATILAHNTEGKSEDLGKLTGNLDVKGTEVEVASTLEKPGYLLDQMDSSVEKHSIDYLDDKSTFDLGDPLSENSGTSSNINNGTDFVDGSDLHVDALHKNNSTLEVADQTEGAGGLQPEPTFNEHQTVSSDATNTSNSHGESVSQEAVRIEAKIDVSSRSHKNEGGESISQAAVIEAKADNNNINEGRSSTLNRAKLESWEGASKRPAREEHNPIFAAFRAFISAFVKFWTE